MRESVSFYIYALFSPDDHDFAFPRYIGKGQGVRAFCHPSGRSTRVQR
jgi:hypothetical protein